MAKGKLIVLEGVDCCGKSLQANLLVENLRKEGYNAYIFEKYKYCNTSYFLKNKMLGREFSPKLSSLIFSMDRFYSYTMEWKELYEEGNVIIFDRYFLSNVIYSCAREEIPRGQKKKMARDIISLEFKEMKLPVPDLTIILDIPFFLQKETLQKRGNLDALEEDDSYRMRCNFYYRRYAEAFKNDSKSSVKTVYVADNTKFKFKKEEVIAGEIKDLALQCLNNNFNNRISKFDLNIFY